MNISSIKKCVNCGACFNVCNLGAISISDNELFYSPEVNLKKCVDCGKCVNVCPVENIAVNNEPKCAYGLWNKDSAVVLNSSSGGAFYGLAKKIIESGGVVYGAAFSDDYRSVQFVSTDTAELSQIMKSKYVESLISDAFERIEKDLKQGRQVLFCGTPCQAQGLVSFLKKEYDNLLVCDFSCGGLPSHYLYNEHLNNLEAKYNSKVNNVDFRPKTHGWGRYAILVGFENGRKYNKIAVLDDYFNAFLYGKYSVRESCLECKFGNNHSSDITLADFWKYKDISTLNNSEGISLVLCNTEKGVAVLESVLSDFEWEILDTKKASYNIKSVRCSEEKKRKRKLFLKDCEESGFRKASRKHLKNSFYTTVRALISNRVHRRK